MSNVNVEKAYRNRSDTPCVSRAINHVSERIGQRAFELFLGRDQNWGSRLDDWLKAERELVFTPDADVVVKDGKVELQISVPGFKPQELQVAACPEALTLVGEVDYKHNRDMHFCKLDHMIIFRRFDMPVSINVDEVAAKLEEGILTVSAPTRQDQAAQTSAAAAA